MTETFCSFIKGVVITAAFSLMKQTTTKKNVRYLKLLRPLIVMYPTWTVWIPISLNLLKFQRIVKNNRAFNDFCFSCVFSFSTLILLSVWIIRFLYLSRFRVLCYVYRTTNFAFVFPQIVTLVLFISIFPPIFSKLLTFLYMFGIIFLEIYVFRN